MSAYAEWKAGLITDAEYAYICKTEEWEIIDPEDEKEEPEEDENEEALFEDDEIIDF